jgi:hypothetical protein
MSYDHWKTTEPDEQWQWLEQDDEAMADMLGVTVDEYLHNKSRDRHSFDGDQNEIDDELPF